MVRTSTTTALACTALFSLTLTACAGADAGGDGASAAEECSESTLRIAHENSTSEPMHAGSVRVKEIVEDLTEGRITVEVFPSGQLGDARTVLEQLQSGTLEASISSPSALSPFYANTSIFSIPYAIAGENEQEQYETLVEVQDSDVVQTMVADMADATGLRVLDWSWWYGNRHITNSKREIVMPADLDGLSIRTPDAAIHVLPLENMGASVTPISFTELYLALQTGTVDGQENPTGVVLAQKFNEVQSFLSTTGHMTQAQSPVISEKYYSTLCVEDQEIVRDAFREAGALVAEQALQLNADALDELREQGMTVTEPDLAPFREANSDAAEQWAQQNSEFSLELYEEFQAAQDGDS